MSEEGQKFLFEATGEGGLSLATQHAQAQDQRVDVAIEAQATLQAAALLRWQRRGGGRWRMGMVSHRRYEAEGPWMAGN